MGFVSNVAGQIRQFWAGDKSQAMMKYAQGAMQATGNPGAAFDVLQSYGYDVLADYLRLEQDLLSRYVDYEEMDEYPEIASALDLYADDASQQDVLQHKALWIAGKFLLDLSRSCPVARAVGTMRPGVDGGLLTSLMPDNPTP